MTCSLLTTVTFSLHVFLKASFTPVLLAAMSLYLKGFISVWMHWSPSGEQDGCALSSVRANWCNECKALDDVCILWSSECVP